VLEDHIIGKDVKNMHMCFFRIQLYKIRLALMKRLAHAKNHENTKSINRESSNCHKNVTICVLVSQSYPDKNGPYR